MQFGYTIIYVEDASATLKFFENTFGLTKKFEHESGGYCELATGETVLAFASFAVAESILPGGITRLKDLDAVAGVEIALVTEDVDQAVEAAVSGGCELLLAPEQKPWGQIVSYVRTPDGILLELCTAVQS